uniref:BZIP domain-containing protein n=1 Tax=Oryza brachyantha TaxID=4533 RepID=J3L649_ORYBR
MAYISRSFPHPQWRFKKPKAHTPEQNRESQRRGKSNRIAQRRRRAATTRSSSSSSENSQPRCGGAEASSASTTPWGSAGTGAPRPAVERRSRRPPILANVGGESSEIAYGVEAELLRVGDVGIGYWRLKFCKCDLLP